MSAGAGALVRFDCPICDRDISTTTRDGVRLRDHRPGRVGASHRADGMCSGSRLPVDLIARVEAVDRATRRERP